MRSVSLNRISATLLLLTLFSSIGCQASYYLHSAYHQTKLLQSRKPIEKVLKYSDLSDEQKRKLRLILDVKAFAESELGLKKSQNYTTYVELEERYVTYIVQVAYAFEFKPYHWKFPFVGKVPYKGYFKKELAEREARRFSSAEFDTFVRGVSAYSTLGWFQDSVLSSMLRYEDYELVELIIHETLHTTLFIKDAAEFNERLATFLGHEGMKLYYKAREGENSKNLELASADTKDQKLFSSFITTELKALKAWYTDNKAQMSAQLKAQRLKELQEKFRRELKPRLKTENYKDFDSRPINNAFLLAYQTYEYSLEDFDKLYTRLNKDYRATLKWLMELENESQPELKLKNFVDQK